MSNKVFTPDNCNDLAAQMSKAANILESHSDGYLEAGKLITLGNLIESIVNNPIVLNSGVIHDVMKKLNP